MARPVLTDLDFNNASRILNLPAASANGHPVNYEQFNAGLEGLAWKDDVKVATQANLDLASPGASIDSIAMSTGDRVLVRSQTDPAENGIYIWNGAATPMTRSVDMDSAAEFTQAIVPIGQGTDAGTQWRQTQIIAAVDTDDVIFTSFGTSAPSASETTAGIAEIATQGETDTGTDDGRFVTPLKLANQANRIRRHEANIGDGAATQIDVTHNFDSRDVSVEVYRNGTPWDTVICDVSRPSTNAVRFNFSVAPTSNQFRVVIKR